MLVLLEGTNLYFTTKISSNLCKLLRKRLQGWVSASAMQVLIPFNNVIFSAGNDLKIMYIQFHKSFSKTERVIFNKIWWKYRCKIFLLFNLVQIILQRLFFATTKFFLYFKIYFSVYDHFAIRGVRLEILWITCV